MTVSLVEPSLDEAVFDDTVFFIAQEVFSAMIDPSDGALSLGSGSPVFSDVTFAWVDMLSTPRRRVMLSTERVTAFSVARALLAAGPDDNVSEADFEDAVGEIANVVGGNVKALVSDPGPLTIPKVSSVPPLDGVLLRQMHLLWHDRSLLISFWSYDESSGC